MNNRNITKALGPFTLSKIGLQEIVRPTLIIVHRGSISETSSKEWESFNSYMSDKTVATLFIIKLCRSSCHNSVDFSRTRERGDYHMSKVCICA